MFYGGPCILELKEECGAFGGLRRHIFLLPTFIMYFLYVFITNVTDIMKRIPNLTMWSRSVTGAERDSAITTNERLF